MAASVLMTWAPHQERFPRSIDGNGTENGQLFQAPFMKGWLLQAEPGVCAF
ncbi:hypothetical protein SynBIOSE41_01399 [Synechococcus sp. BIOS-E4-1]|nr:hypothetical protein SynBIOSE41_01399 [Synechococcus sp. BIOS-E4-1]